MCNGNGGGGGEKIGKKEEGEDFGMPNLRGKMERRSLIKNLGG